jgi:plasmid stabilization system protein ParE
MRRIVWSRPASRDRRQHFLFLAEHNPAAAPRVDDAIRAAVARLLDQPNLGRPGEREGTRELVVRAYPAYIVVYRVIGSEVRILRVWHERQDRQQR